MSRIRSDRLAARLTGALASMVVLCGSAASLDAQELRQVASSEYTISGSNASLKLEFDGGESLSMAIRDGGVFIDGVRVGDAARGSSLDRQWRDLLTRAMDAAPAELPQILIDWAAEGDVGRRMDSALDAALSGDAAPLESANVDAAAAAPPTSDSVSRLVERISELEERLEQRSRDVRVSRPAPRPRSPFRSISEGIAGIFSIMVTYLVLFAIAFGVIFFGGRRYIEGVADTARHATGRSLFVGMAAAFLVVPAFVLGMIALIISIVGIPALLVWIPGFPLAVVLSVLLGYLGVAHATGEAFAERRFYVTDWFQRGNSYYFLLSGLGLLLALFLASQVVHMAGPWLRPISGVLIFLGVVTTLIAACVGFGAVLLSRGGTQPVRGSGMAQEPDLFTEDDSV